jgi:hypothetical protein
MSTKDRDDDDDAPCASPHRKDAASIRSLLDDAHAQGRQLERRAQRPLFALSLVLLFGGVSSYAVLRNTPYRAITSFLMPMSVIVLNAALLPTNRWGIRTMVLLLSLTLITLGCAVAAETAASLALVSADTIGSTRRCATAPHLSLSGGSTSEYVPCWFINWNAYLSLIKAAAVLATGVRFAATLVHWRRPRRLLHHLWRAFFWIVVMIGVICCEMLLAALARARPANFYVGGVLLVASLGLVLFVHYRPELRERFYAWRLRQGAGVVSAGAIATLISVAASDDGGTVGARGLASLRSLRADKLSVEQMSSNAPDPALYAATEPALVGEIDVRAAAPRPSQRRPRRATMKAARSHERALYVPPSRAHARVSRRSHPLAQPLPLTCASASCRTRRPSSRTRGATSRTRSGRCFRRGARAL